MSASAGSLRPATSRALRVIALGMGAGVALLSGLVVWLALRAPERAPSLESVRAVNAATLIAMVLALASIAASEIAWKARLRGAAAEDLDRRAAQAFLLRSILREAGALFGCAAAFPAAMGGVLRAYPAYWADLAPAALFGSYLWLHWPTDERLKAELAEALGEAPQKP